MEEKTAIVMGLLKVVGKTTVILNVVDIQGRIAALHATLMREYDDYFGDYSGNFLAVTNTMSISFCPSNCAIDMEGDGELPIVTVKES